MAWTGGSTKSTGDVITAAIWNNYLGASGSIDETAPAKVTTAGDLVYGTGTNALARLGIGSANTVLKSSGSAPAWGTVAATEMTANNWKLFYSNGSGAVQELALAASGVLTANGTSAAPTFESAASGGSIAMTSSGSITAGDMVIENTDGTVSTVTSTLQSWSMTSTVSLSGYAYGMNHKAVYDDANSVTCYAYRNSNDSNNTWVAFVSESGGTVTVANEQKILDYYNPSGSGHYYSLCEFGYDDHNDVYLAIFRNGNTGATHGLAFTYNGSSVTIGSLTVIENTYLNNTDDYQGMCWDTTNNVFHLTMNTYDTTNRYIIQYISVTSGRVITASASTAIASSSAITNAYFPICAWDSTNEKVFCGFQPANASEHFDYYPVAFNGSTYTVGTLTAIGDELAYTTQCVFDSTTGQVLVAWTAGSNGDIYMNAVDMSDDSIGTEVNLSTTYAGADADTNIEWGGYIWQSYRNQSLFITDASSGWVLRTGAMYGSYVVSGTLGAGKAITLGESNPYFNSTLECTSAYQGQANAWDSSSSKLITIINTTSAGSVAAVTPSMGATNVQKWLGFAESTVGTGVSVNVTHAGGVNESQSGLTVGSTYYLDADGALTATAPTATVGNQWKKVGKAITATNLLVSGVGDTTKSWTD